MSEKIWVSVHDGGPVETANYVTVCLVDKQLWEDYAEDEVHYSEFIDKAERSFQLLELIDNMDYTN